MKVGDLVRHHPENSTVSKLFEDWGHTRDFGCGIIIDVSDASNASGSIFYRISAAPMFEPKWYQKEELELISEGNN